MKVIWEGKKRAGWIWVGGNPNNLDIPWKLAYYRKEIWVHVRCPICEKYIRVRQSERVVRHRPKGAGKGSPLCALGSLPLEEVRKIALVREEFGQ